MSLGFSVEALVPKARVSGPLRMGLVRLDESEWLEPEPDLAARALKPDKAVRGLTGLDGPWQGDATAWLAADGLAPTPHDAALGTIGGGNHFAELQAVARVAKRIRGK